MKKLLKVLHVEDSERDVALLTRHLSRAGYELISERVDTPEAMKAALSEREWDVILSDYSMPHFSALSALAVLKETGLDIPFIIISGTIGEEIAVEAMRAGASDYLMKDNLARLVPTVERETQEAENRRARRRVEAELRQSETQYRRLIDTAYEGIWIADAGARIIYANQRLAEMLGYTVEEMMGRSAFEALHESDSEEMKIKWQRRLQGIKEQYDLRLRRKDGSDLWVIFSATPIRDERGEVTGALAMLTDITGRKRAEQQIRLQATALEAAANAIVITDSKGVISWVNPAFNALTGYATEGVSGRNIRILKSGEHDAAFYKKLWDTVLSGQVWHGEMINRRRDGSLYFEEQTITPVTNEAGEIINFIAIKQDITDRKRAGEERAKLTAQIEKERQHLINIVMSVPGVVWEAWGEPDAATQRIDFVSDYVQTMLGYSVEEWLSTPNFWLSVVHPEDRERAGRAAAANFTSAGQAVMEFRWVAKDGRVIWVESNSTVITDDEGRPIGLRGVTIDITERKKLEEQFRQSQKLEAVGMLAGGIAHDFNNLLTAITGYSELTLRQLQAADPLRQNIEEIKKAGERAAALTRQLLAFSRKQVLQPKVLDLNGVVSELEKMLRRLIGEDVELRTVLEAGLGNIKADPGQIEQIIMNLVVNARDAMPQGGKLTIETQNVKLDEDYAKNHVAVTPGHYVMLAVSDAGTGMDEKTRARIFEPFFTTKEAGKGTGLGLSTVYGIVKQSGGNIWVYSEVGRGTTFKVYLPRVDEGAEEYKRSAETEEAVRGAETILLAEDEEIVRKLARQVLELYGYRVLEAANGGAALLICERHPETIDLLITDVVMPEMSGRELADRLAGLRPEMKVLYMSGYTDNAIVHQGVLDEGANFIQKPFPTDALARKVREVLDAPKKSS